MYCRACGAPNEPDAKFCERCGADLGAAPRPTAGPLDRAVSALRAPSVVYLPARPRAWWYPIGVWLILAAFFLFVDVLPGGGVDWAYWPIGILGIFLVGFPLLNLLEARLARGRGPG